MGRARRMAAIATLAGFLASGAVVAGGPSAQAANLGTVTWNGTTLSGNNLTGAVNDTYTFTNTSGSSVIIENDSGFVSIGGTSCGFGGPCTVANGATATVTVNTLGFVGVWQSFLRKGYITVSAGSVTPSGGGSSNSSSTSAGNSGPTPILQQFATPAMGTCDAAQPEGLNWAGVASGGWGESWAQWANGGRGGTVCTRMLEYVNSWRIAP